jgi:sugar transferase (PEP-CTERM/EpsH1 system associated)
VVARRACFEQLGEFDEAHELVSVEDYDMWLRIAERHDVAYIEQPLVRYRAHPGGISRNIARSYLGEQRVIEKAIARNAAQRPWVGRVRNARLAKIFFACAQEYFAADDFANARAYAARSLRHQPLQGRAWGYWLATLFGRPAVRAVRSLRGTAGANGRHQPIRVMHVLYSVDTGGAEHVVLNVARHLDRSAYAIEVCSLTGRGSLADAFERLGVPVTAMGKGPGADPWLWVRLAALFRAQRIDVVHTHNVTPWLYAGVAAKLAGVRLVHTEHSNLFAHQWRLQAAERVLARFTETIISDSEKVARTLMTQGVPEARIRTIVNGIDTVRFSAARPLDAKRSAIGLERPQLIVGTVGRLVPVKDHRTLLEAFARICRAVPEAVLVIVGDGPEREVLERCAAALGVGEQVRWFGERADVQDLVPFFDVFVLSSVSEGLPLTLLEAMAAGRAVVATRVGGIPEALAEGTGLLVPPKDPEALAHAVITLLGDAPRRLAMGALAAQRARAHFDVHDMVRAYANTYHH